MAENKPTYPANNFEDAVDIAIIASNQLHDIINGDGATSVVVESGDIPTVRKSFLDNMHFLEPLPWASGLSETKFNQIRSIIKTEVNQEVWYYSPYATKDNPVLMGSSPIGDSNWRIYVTSLDNNEFINEIKEAGEGFLKDSKEAATQSQMYSLDSMKYRDQAEQYAGEAKVNTDVYQTLEDAQAAINSGAEKRKYFNIIGKDMSWVDRYENVNGVATFTGDTLPNLRSVEEMKKDLDKVLPKFNLKSSLSDAHLIVQAEGGEDVGLVLDKNFSLLLAGLDEPVQDALLSLISKVNIHYNLKDWQFVVVDKELNNILVGLDNDGGFWVPGLNKPLQDMLENISDLISVNNNMVGWHSVVVDKDKGNILSGIDNDGGFWVPGLDEPIQDALGKTKNTNLKVVDHALSLLNDSGEVIYNEFPVVSAQKMSPNFFLVSIVNEDKVVAGRMTRFKHNDFNYYPHSLRPQIIAPSAKEIHYHDEAGQSLALGGGGSKRALSVYNNTYAPWALMFGGSGQARSSSDIANKEALLGFTAAFTEIWQQTAIVASLQHQVQLRISNNIPQSSWPLTIGRVNARGGTTLSGIEKGTMIYNASLKAIDAFYDRSDELGLNPLVKTLRLNHGGDDSHIVTDFGQYKQGIVKYKKDKITDLLALGKQDEVPLFMIPQLGNRTREVHSTKGMAYGDMIAQDQLDFSEEDSGVIMPLSQWFINREYHFDFAHVVADGYALIGEYYEQARAYQVDKIGNTTNIKWEPVKPKTWYWEDNVLVMNYHSPFGTPLKINSDRGSVIGGGFSLLNKSATPLSIEQTGSVQFKITFDKVPDTNDFIQVGFNPTDNFRVDDGSGTIIDWKFPLVMISDSSERISTVVPNKKLTNWSILAGKLPLTKS